MKKSQIYADDVIFEFNLKDDGTPLLHVRDDAGYFKPAPIDESFKADSVTGNTRVDEDAFMVHVEGFVGGKPVTRYALSQVVSRESVS